MAHRNSILKSLWMRVALRGVHFADRHSRINRFYRIEDPWGMQTQRERFRFSETNRIIGAYFGRPKRIMEIGCGEGHQSAELLTICDHLFGIDISPRAIARAKRRCPTATFTVGDITSARVPQELLPFDLVIACEVLYYMQDVSAALATMSRLGNGCLVTFVDSRRDRLDPLIAAIPGATSQRFEFEGTWWTAAWWRPQIGIVDASNHAK